MARLAERIAALAVSLFVALVFTGAQWLFAADPTPRYGGTLRVSDNNDGVSIGYPPKMVKTLYAFRQASPAIETLLRSDKAGQLIPWLATEVKEDAKAKTISLTLRKGVRFQDGTDFNAEAVKWNLDQHVAAKTAGTEKITGVEAGNGSTVRIRLSGWDSTVTGNLAQFLGMVVSPAAYRKNGEAWCEKNAVGTGPFQLASWEKDVRTVYRKFDGYWQKGKPYLDRVELVPILDPLTRELSLRRGEFDLALRMPPKCLAGFKKDGYVVNGVRGGSCAVSLVPDSANPNSPFSNLKVRQAVQHAIDTITIAEKVFYGEVTPANQQVYKGHWGYNPAVNGFPYNPAKAKQLLAEAGFPNGFKTKLLYWASPENDQVFAVVQGFLREVRIEVELEPAQTARYQQVAWQGGKWEGLIMAQPTGNPDVVAPLILWYAGAGKAYTQMAVPRDYAQTIEDAVSAANMKSKQKSVQQAMKLMIDKYALTIPLYFMPDFSAGRTGLHNHGIYETPNLAAWTPEEAWVEK